MVEEASGGFRRRRDAVGEDDAGHHLFLADVIRSGEAGDGGDAVVLEKAVFHLRRRDVFARAADDVFLAVDEINHAGFVHRHRVAGVEPAAAPRLGGRFGFVQIAREETLFRGRGGMAEGHFAGGSARNFVVVFIDNPHLQIVAGAAHRAGVDHARLLIHDQHAAHLRHAPAFDEGDAEAVFESAMKGGLDPGAETDADIAEVIRPGGLVRHEDGDDDAEIVKDRRPGRAAVSPPGGGGETFGDDLGVARQDNAKKADDPGVDVEKGQRIDHPVASLFHPDGRACDQIGGAIHQLRLVRDHAALRATRRAGGVDQARLSLRRRGARRGGRRRSGRERLHPLEDDDGGRIRRLRRAFAHQFGAIRLSNSEVGAGIIQQVCDFAGPVVGVHRDKADAEAVHRQFDEEKLRPVPHQKRDAVAMAVTRVRQHRFQRGDVPVGFGVGPCLWRAAVRIGLDEEISVRPPRSGLRPYVSDGLAVCVDHARPPVTRRSFSPPRGAVQRAEAGTHRSAQYEASTRRRPPRRAALQYETRKIIPRRARRDRRRWPRALPLFSPSGSSSSAPCYRQELREGTPWDRR